MTAAPGITVCVPLAIRRRGGRKLVVTPAGGVPGATPACTRADPALVKALARAHRWKRLLERPLRLAREAGRGREDRPVLPPRTLRLTLLAPDIVEAILDGRQAWSLALPALSDAMPIL
jgi:hypothetical protein